jgi:hypothetical protein
MGVFDDKKFEGMDWMSQITETIESDLNTVLAGLPDKILFNIKDMHDFHGGYGEWFYVRHSDIVSKLFQQTGLSGDEINVVGECFKLEASEDLMVDLENNIMTGTLAVIKKAHTLSDEDLQPLMGKRGTKSLRNRLFNHEADKPTIDRANEILDLLGNCEENKRTKSFRKKTSRIIERLNEIFETNEWRIRDMTLANKLSVWVGDYILNGNLSGLVNFCKIKVMTHNNMPIYSVEEEK